VTAGPAGNDRGMTSPHQDQPLAAREGLNEGSADSTAETAGVPAPLDQLVGDPTDSTAVAQSQTGEPVDMESDGARAMRDDAGPGQQLEAGEG
jgi:hypothetical protein